MRKATVSEQKNERVTLRHGTRAALVCERELPVAECVAARHARELSDALLSHAERAYFPVAAAELESLCGAGRGYAFKPHRLIFRARLKPAGAGMQLWLSLCYTVGDEVRIAQSASSLWTADGRYRLCRVPRKKRKSAVEK